MIERRVTVRCDGHGGSCVSREFADGLRAEVARDELSAEGWTRRGRRDYCPDCSRERAKPALKPNAAQPMTVIGANEAAALLGINRNTLYAAANAGRIPCRRLGRKFVFVREVLIEWLRGGS